MRSLTANARSEKISIVGLVMPFNLQLGLFAPFAVDLARGLGLGSLAGGQGGKAPPAQAQLIAHVLYHLQYGNNSMLERDGVDGCERILIILLTIKTARWRCVCLMK